MSTQQEAAAMREQARNQLIQEKSDEIKNLSHDLTSMLPKADVIKQLPEDIFKNVFLPLFLGQPNPKYPTISGGNWAAFAGSPHAPVDVIDPAGKILFRVPALMHNQLLAPLTGTGGVDMEFIVKQAQLYSSTLPQQADEYLRAELTKRTPLMKSDTDVSEIVEAWNKIFVFYGLVKPVTQSPSSDKPSVELDYEDVPP